MDGDPAPAVHPALDHGVGAPQGEDGGPGDEGHSCQVPVEFLHGPNMGSGAAPAYLPVFP